MNVKDITGQTFGRLEVLEFVESRQVGKNKKRFYKCKCSCGNEVVTSREGLVSGNTNSCGCLAKEMTLERNKTKRLPDNQSLWNLGYKAHLKDAKIRGYESELSPEDYREITSQDCYYCGKPPQSKTHPNLYGEIFRNGVDRIDSSKGYTKDNVRPCCSTCNYMKLDMTEQEFFEHINRIGERHTPKKKCS